jgi:hypothetical protein
MAPLPARWRMPVFPLSVYHNSVICGLAVVRKPITRFDFGFLPAFLPAAKKSFVYKNFQAFLSFFIYNLFQIKSFFVEI